MIIVDFAVSPRNPIVRAGTPVVGKGPLRRVSDYLFLAYKQACQDAHQDVTPCLKRINWVIRHSVTTPLSVDVATLVTGRATNYALWRGEPYYLDGEQGKALLGCLVPLNVVLR